MKGGAKNHLTLDIWHLTFVICHRMRTQVCLCTATLGMRSDPCQCATLLTEPKSGSDRVRSPLKVVSWESGPGRYSIMKGRPNSSNLVVAQRLQVKAEGEPYET